ncbi:DUF6603 domain-containing protein [Embleya sp. NPDC050154]|uniref:DUF6603 domain-containing protein n=1 Tax=Embleya sp. NPDC050154 TaxID=3363988 RepID=UPI00378CE04A
MAIPVPALLELFDAASTSGRLELSGATLDIPEVAALFDGYLNGGLTLSTPVFDREQLAADGTSDIPELGAKLATRVVFLADEPGEFVTGCRVEVATDSWTVKAPYLETDLTLLATLGFDRLWITFAAAPDTPGGRLRPDVYPTVSFSVGATGGRRTLRLVGTESPMVGLSGHFPNGISFERLTDLAALPFLDTSLLDRVHVPVEISGGLGALSLMSANVTFDRYRGRLEEVAVTLGLTGQADWPLIPDLVRLDRIDPLRIRAARDRLGTWRVDFTLGARCTVAGTYALHGEAALPAGRIAASLWHPEGGNDLIEAGALADTGIDPDSVRLNYIHISADVTSRAYTLALALDTSWRIADGVELTGLELRTAGTGLAPPNDIALTGTLTMGDSRIVLEGRRRPDRVWEVAGSAFAVDFAGFAAWFHTTFGKPLPEAVSGLVVDRVQVSLDSTLAGSILCAGSFPLGDGPDGAMFTLSASAGAKPPSGPRPVAFSADLSVVVEVDGADVVLDFEVAFGTGSAGSRFTASWEAGEAGRSVPLLALARGLGLPAEELRGLWPTALQPSLRSVHFTYDGAARSMVVAAESAQGAVVFASLPLDPLVPERSVVLLQVGVNIQAGLSDVPLLGGMVPAGADLRLTRVRGVYASLDVPVAVVDRVNALVAGADPSLPLFLRPVAAPGQAAGVLPRGAVLVVDYQVPGGTPASLTLALSSGPSAPGGGAGPGASVAARPVGPRPADEDPDGSVANSTDTDTGTGTGTGTVTGGTGGPPAVPLSERVLEGVALPPGDPPPPAPVASERPGVWVEIGRSFGPFLVRRIGLAYDKGVVWLGVDGALTASGFTMAVDGLALGLDLDADDGDDIGIETRLSGLGVEFERAPLRIAGALIDRTPPPTGFTMMVAGTLVVQMPQFGVTAVGAYQRRDDGMVSLFVFGRGTLALGGPPAFRVTGVAAGFGFNSSLKIPGPTEVATFPLLGELDGTRPTDPMDMLERLTGTWVTARQGGLWLAAGLDFTSFEFIHGRLLLILETGDGLNLALVGTARAAFPRTDTAYAQVQLQLRIVYSSKRAEFAATALLYDSYLIDPACVLTGGFAFHMWFEGSAHSGDFALTVGGYHPKYKAPTHYPQVPRLGFSWSLGSISITGTSFFALTPSAVMAGGTLDVRYSSGALNAWFSAYAHLLISWKPFHFAMGVGISLGASLKVWFATLRGELSASLDLWGPPTGGRATAKFTFIRVTVTFGPGESKPAALTWPEFKELLPPADKVLRIAASEGLLADAEPPPGRNPQDPQAPWLVDASGFTFLAETSVPATSVVFQTRVPDTGAELLDIRPMERTGLTSTFTVRVARDRALRGAAPLWEALADDGAWRVETVFGSVPTALWGSPRPGNEAMLDAAKRLLPARRTGLRVTIPPPVPTGVPLERIAEASLAYEDLEDAASPLDPDDPATGDRARLAPGTGVGTVATTIATTAAERTGLADALAALLDPLPNSPLDAFAAHVNRDGLPAAPLLFATATGATADDTPGTTTQDPPASAPHEPAAP